MESCWHEKPNSRPSFKTLETLLGDMLGETEKQVKNFYIFYKKLQHSIQLFCKISRTMFFV